MLSPEEIDAYLEPLTEDQRASVRAFRSLIQQHCPDLAEKVDTGKWFRGMLTYTSPEGTFLYALGPRSGGDSTFHMMPYYASPVLKDRHGEALKKLESGKSCIRFKRPDQVPMDAIEDILVNGTAGMLAMMEAPAVATGAR